MRDLIRHYHEHLKLKSNAAPVTIHDARKFRNWAPPVLPAASERPMSRKQILARDPKAFAADAQEFSRFVPIPTVWYGMIGEKTTKRVTMQDGSTVKVTLRSCQVITRSIQDGRSIPCKS